MASVNAASSARTFRCRRCVERDWPITAHARRSDTESCERTWSTHARLREGLSISRQGFLQDLLVERQGAAAYFPAAEMKRLEFFLPEQLVAHLNSPEARPIQAETVSRGYKVKISQASPDLKQGKQRRDAITGVIAQSLKRMKSKAPD